MVKIVEAPKNVPASEKAAALYTGIQKRNEAIRKDLIKQQESQLWKELGGGLLKMGYESIMDQRLAEKSANFFANEEYLSNQALASKAMTNATTHLNRNAEALKHDAGEKAYWKNYWVDNIYLPKINKFAVDSTSPKDLAALRSIAAQHVEQDFETLWGDKIKMDDAALKVKAAAGDENLTQFYAAWDAARKNTGTIESQRLSELGNLAFGKNEPINPGTLLTSNKALQEMTGTFTKFNAQYVDYVSKGLDPNVAQVLVDEAKSLPNVQVKYDRFNYEFYNPITGKNEKITVWEALDQQGNKTGKVIHGTRIDKDGKESPITPQERELLEYSPDAKLTETEYKNLLPEIEAGRKIMQAEDINMEKTALEEERKRIKEDGGDDTAITQGVARMKRNQNLVLYNRKRFLKQKYGAAFSTEAYYRMAGSMDRLQKEFSDTSKYGYKATNTDGTFPARANTYQELVKFYPMRVDNPFFIQHVMEKSGYIPTGYLKDLLKDDKTRRVSFGSKFYSASDKVRDVVFMQQFVQGYTKGNNIASLTVDEYNKTVLGLGSKRHGSNALPNSNTFLLRDTKEIKDPKTEVSTVNTGDDTGDKTGGGTVLNTEKTLYEQYDDKIKQMYAEGKIGMLSDIPAQLVNLKNVDREITQIKNRLSELETNPEQAQATANTSQKGGPKRTVLEVVQQRLKELETKRAGYISNLPTLTEQ